ncbi:NYN domain-containing protein, partial [Rubrivivax gelatinosus]|uniref:NYN domain-containing protein n=1 Tax=Rubrivivax gelatinosus TaxID=28068 RepID=UPI001F5BEA7C
MKSALFVDFDNVFSQLRQLQPDAAERFARHPSEWIGWLTSALVLPDPHEDGERRRLLVRRCYLNPNWYQTYRHAFLRAGFEIVDCPPVTSQGKTSTDIHMVLDIVDLLQHETRCDEFIVFSADADFTPVLRKLRRYDRRTTVLAIGFPSAAYQASADLLIDERVFLRDALALGQPGTDAAAAPIAPAADGADSRAAAAPGP